LFIPTRDLNLGNTVNIIAIILTSLIEKGLQATTSKNREKSV